MWIRVSWYRKIRELLQMNLTPSNKHNKICYIDLILKVLIALLGIMFRMRNIRCCSVQTTNIMVQVSIIKVMMIFLLQEKKLLLAFTVTMLLCLFYTVRQTIHPQACLVSSTNVSRHELCNTMNENHQPKIPFLLFSFLLQENRGSFRKISLN